MNDTIDGCVICDIAGGAIYVGVDESVLKTSSNSTQYLNGNSITNNVVNNVAADYSGGVGIFAEFALNTSISNNTLHTLPYRALSTGGDFKRAVAASSEFYTLNNNQVHNGELIGRDTGVIDTLAGNGTSTQNSTVNGNYIYGDTRHSPLPNQNFSFYLEAGSAYYTISGNVFIQAPAYDPGCVDPDSTPNLPGWLFINDFYQNGLIDPTVDDPECNTIQSNYFFPQVSPTAHGICHISGGTALTFNTYGTNTQLTSASQSSWPTAAVNIAAASGVGSTYTGLLTAIPVNVDDTVTGAGSNQFSYTGTGWGSCIGPANCGDPTGFLYNDSNSWSNITGDYLTITFTGTRIDFYGAADPTNGIASASIDGGTGVDVDEYNATRQGNVLFYTSGPLTAGTHTLTLTVTGRKNANSTGTYLTVEHVRILQQ